MPRRLYLVRHGQTNANVLNIIAGKGPDMPLNETGLKQAKLTAEAMAHTPFNHIYTSPAARTKQTAQKIYEHHEPLIPLVFAEILPSLLEINFGVLEGLTYKKAKELYGDLLETYSKNPSRCAFPKGESMNEAYERVGRGINRVLIEHPQNESVLIVSHGGTLALIFLYLFDLDMDKMFHAIRHNNCGLSIIDLENDALNAPQHRPRIICMNDIGHLKEGHY